MKNNFGSYENVIILDACRYDFFKEFYKLFPHLKEGELSKHRSNASCTPQFLKKNMQNTGFNVLSAQPFVNSLGLNIQDLHDGDTDYVATYNFGEITDLWADSEPCVKPMEMADYVVEEDVEEYDIVWMIQPHTPYVGSIRLDCEPRIFDGALPVPGQTVGITTVKPQMATFLRSAYMYNLLRALYAVEVILSELEGLTLITSDHGEVLGEGEGFGHPKGLVVDELREVPRLELDASNVEKNINEVELNEFIEMFYKSVLDREADDEGLKNYSEELGSSLKREVFPEVLMLSDEYEEENGDARTITFMFDEN